MAEPCVEQLLLNASENSKRILILILRFGMALVFKKLQKMFSLKKSVDL